MNTGWVPKINIYISPSTHSHSTHKITKIIIMEECPWHCTVMYTNKKRVNGKNILKNICVIFSMNILQCGM